MRLRVSISLLLVLVGLPAASHASGTLQERATSLGLSCREMQGTGISFIRCDGMVPSFDQTPLDVSVSLPASNGEAALPTVLQLGGWPGAKWRVSNRCGVRTECDPNWPEAYHWNEVWFTQRGYAHLTYQARGFGASCGRDQTDPVCMQGYTHLADGAFEIKDSQHLIGVIVDAGIADASRIAATGESYGGGQTWKLAASMPWSSPNGVPLQLAVAIPTKPWTDLHGALVPNGRATADVDQTASHDRPYGVVKSAYTTGFYAIGLNDGNGRYNMTDPADLASNFNAALAVWNAADSPDPVLRTQIAEAWRGKSAYYADDYLDALRSGVVDPVPTFAVSGWTDPLFPVVESMQMYRKLRAADPDFPITLAFADAGHDAYHAPFAEWRVLSEQLNAFLDAHLKGIGVAPQGVMSLATSCPSAPEPPVWSDDLDTLANASQVAQLDDASIAWSPARDDPRAAPPIAGVVSGLRCPTNQSITSGPDVSRHTIPVTTGFTMLGLPALSAAYALDGPSALLVAKIWDRAPDGTETLVTRGLYRLDVLDGDGATGTLRMQLNGNHWRFAAGHEIVVELASSDTPYVRPNYNPFVLRLSGARLDVPTRA